MPKQIASSEFEILIEIAGRFPDGASLDDIGRDLGGDLPRRTLQRRLARLVEGGRLSRGGRGRGSRYRVPRNEGEAARFSAGTRIAEGQARRLPPPPGAPPRPSADTSAVRERARTAEGYARVGEDDIPVSAEGEAIRRAVRAPIQDRRPVGYDRTFLDRYRPNETFYLPLDARRRLLDMGRSPVASVPPGPMRERSITGC